jgi:ankyrin repeat protein
MNYYQKYIKYKTKYLNLLKGGEVPQIDCDLLPFEKEDINIIYQDRFILQNNEDSDKNYLLNSEYQFEKTKINIEESLFNIFDISMFANFSIILGCDLIPFHIGSLQFNFNIIIGLLHYLEYTIKKKDGLGNEMNDFKTFLISKIFNIKNEEKNSKNPPIYIFLGISNINSILNCFSFFNKLYELLNYLLLNDFNKENINQLFPNIENIKDFYNIYSFFYTEDKEDKICIEKKKNKEEKKEIAIKKYLQSNINDNNLFYDDINKLKKFIKNCNTIDEKIKFKLMFGISLINLILINWIYLRIFNTKLIIGSLSQNLYPINTINFLENIFQLNEEKIYNYAEEKKQLNINNDINIFLLNKIEIPIVDYSISTRNGVRFSNCVENAVLQLLKILSWENNKYNIELLPQEINQSIKNIILKINNESSKKETNEIIDEFVELVSKDPNINYRDNGYQIISNIENVGNVLNLVLNGKTIPGGINDYNNNIFKTINDKFEDYYNLEQKNGIINIKKKNYILNLEIKDGHSHIINKNDNIYSFINKYKYLNILYIFLYNRDEKIIYSLDFKFFYNCQTIDIQQFLINKIINILNILLNECENSTDAIGNNCLHIACMFSNKVLLNEYLIKNYADINSVNNLGESPLLITSIKGDYDCLQLLIKNKADVNKVDNNGTLPLFIASSNGYLNCIELLIENNSDINYKTNDGFTPLTIASTNGHFECIKLLIEKCADINNFGFESPFLNACKSGNHDCVKLFIDKGIYVYQVDSENNTALSLVSLSGDYKSVELLINKRLDVNAVNNNDKTPLILACSIFAAKQKNNFECIDLLIKNGADVNKIDNEGYTALLLQSCNGNFECVKLLIENGADINKLDNENNTPLLLAARTKNYKCIELLIDKCLDVNAVNNFDKTPLLIASEFCSNKCIKLLINNGAIVDKVDNDGNTPLMLVSNNNNFKCIKLLIENNADVNKVNHNGDTSLLLASDNCNLECIKLLIKSEADINKANNVGTTPLLIASKNGNYEYIKLLIENRVNINLRTKLTILKIVIENDYLKCFELLINNLTNNENILLHLCMLGKYKYIDILIKNCVNINYINNGFTPLIVASISGHYKCIELLINNGAIVDNVDNDGNTSLILASKNGHYKCIELLIKNCADINKNGINNFTPLIVASISGHYKCIELLINNGAIVDNVDNDGNTSLMVVSIFGHYKCIELLINYGAIIDKVNSLGNTSLILASGNGHYKCIELLIKNCANVNIVNNYGKTALMVASENCHVNCIELLQ